MQTQLIAQHLNEAITFNGRCKLLSFNTTDLPRAQVLQTFTFALLDSHNPIPINDFNEACYSAINECNAQLSDPDYTDFTTEACYIISKSPFYILMAIGELD